MKGIAMCRVKARIQSGPIESERFAYVTTCEGTEAEIILPESQTGPGTIDAWDVLVDDKRVLVEFPRETTAGYWRAWIPRDLVEGLR